MSISPSAGLFLREAKAYLRSAQLLHTDALTASKDLADWKNLNPMYFLLLNACELAIKALALARGRVPPKSHDIVKLLRYVSVSADRAQLRTLSADVRQLQAARCRERWSGAGGLVARAAMEQELEDIQSRPTGLAGAFRTPGALGQSDLTKIEFGKEVANWWHGVRYPRVGWIRYPDFDVCNLVCESLISRAEDELKGGKEC